MQNNEYFFIDKGTFSTLRDKKIWYDQQFLFRIYTTKDVMVLQKWTVWSSESNNFESIWLEYAGKNEF